PQPNAFTKETPSFAVAADGPVRRRAARSQGLWNLHVMPAGAATESVYLIDAHSLIFQVFHAIPEMSSPSGLPTNALFGFTRDMLFVRKEKKPDYLVCAFDVAGPTFRDHLYAEYKAKRAPMPDDLFAQIALIEQMLEAMRIPVLGVPGFEADDLLATLAREA